MTLRVWAMGAAAVMMMMVSAGGAANASAASEAKTAPGEKLVCKVRARTGTRFGTKTCRTAAQWDQISVENQRAFKETVDRPQIKVCGPSGCD